MSPKKGTIQFYEFVRYLLIQKYEALLEVLNKANSKESVDHLLVLGDVVGYYYHPDKILNLLSKWNFFNQGNHENILENLLNDSSLRKFFGFNRQWASRSYKNDK